jgi:hypothetical protein
LTITAAMIIYGMAGFVQELNQTSKSNRILDTARHFDSLGNHLKDQTVSSLFDFLILRLEMLIYFGCRKIRHSSAVMWKNM